MTQPLVIGSRRELFVDDTLIERLSGSAALAINPPVRAEVVFQAKPPLENSCSMVYSTLICHEDKIFLYYRGNAEGKDDSGAPLKQPVAQLALSSSGIDFERPEFGIYEFNGSSKNNVIWQGEQAHNMIPFLDTNPACPPEARFKAVGGSTQNNLYAMVSPDGVHWKLLQDKPLAVSGMFDSANLAFWDAQLGKYRLFSRFFDHNHVRAIQSSTSDDFLNWTTPLAHEYEIGTPDEHLYTNATMPVPGAEHILLSFPMRYMVHRTTPLEDTSAMEYPGANAHGMNGITDAIMMSSRDGVHWKRPFHGAWLRPGLDDRNWTHRNNTPCIGILPLSENEWSMYVSEHYGWPDHRLRRLIIRPWGFAGVRAGTTGGSLLTKPFIFSGKELRLNFSTSAAGSVAVGLVRADGAVIEGRSIVDQKPFFGDKLDAVVAWKNGASVADLAGEAVRLHCDLVDADLYAFRFA